MSLYSIVWKYQINPEHRERFELEYGAEGSWNSLFSQSEHYKGSFLHLSADDPDTYLLIDTWASKTPYEDFISANKEAYEALSSKFEYLHNKEEKIGTFDTVG